MHIIDIKVSELTSTDTRARGFVTLESDRGHVQLHCSIRPGSASTPRAALISEALRQLGRMPEFRNGRDSFSFAPGILHNAPEIA